VPPIHPAFVAKIVSNYVINNKIAPAELPALIGTVHHSLLSLGKAAEPEQPRTPAVATRRSVTPNYVVCLECGWRGQLLRRHVHEIHGLGPNQYRARWGLSAEHPLTAPADSERRSALAKQLGLGQMRTGRRRPQQANR
jgi:MucR family transcriptional regulator, transcriptional regulator of exopolysaccharide biosynthesis